MSTPYHYTMCGLDNVWLSNGFTLEESPYGPTVHIEDPEGLDHAIALLLLEKQSPLSGKELRFLRQQIGLSQADLGATVGADVQTVARWEKNDEGTDSPATRLARAVFVLHLGGNEDLRRYVANLKLMDRVLNERIVFSEHDGDWQASPNEPCPA